MINIFTPFLLARVPSQNPFAIGCKRSPPTVEIRRTVGERLLTFATVSLYRTQGSVLETYWDKNGMLVPGTSSTTAMFSTNYKENLKFK